MAEQPNKVIVERNSNGPWVALIALILLAVVGVGGFALIQSENHKDNAVASAADQVGDAAEDVGDAVKDATN